MSSPSSMEPLVPEDHKHQLEELSTELLSRASSLGGRIHPILQQGLGDLVRAMNCYYSNLIEGHDTHPIDIGRVKQRSKLTPDWSASLEADSVMIGN